MADTETNKKKERPAPPKRTDPAAYTGKSDKEDEALLAEMHEEYDYSFEAWQDIRAEADEDMQYVSGNPWTTDDREARKGRPIVIADQLHQYLNQLVNTVRQNKRTGKVTPEGNGANDESARYLSSRMREIEYRSHSQEAYTVAFQNAAQRSYGFARLYTEYESPRSQNQRLCIEAIPNPDQCLPGGDWKSTAGKDWNDFWFTCTLSKAEFKRRFPGAKVQDFGLEEQGAAPRWVQNDRIQIAEWWRRRPVTRKCYEIQPPPPPAKLGAPPSQLPPTVVWIDGVDGDRPVGDVVDEWTRDVPEVCQYFTNGIELLHEPGKPKKTIWKGQYIPFAGCFGEILYLSEGGVQKKVILSYIRLARDPQKLLNWIESTKLEVMGMQPRTPYMAYEGQLSPSQKTKLAQSLHTPVAVIEAKAFTTETGQTVLPLPRRELPDVSSLAGYEMAAEAAKRNIQNALGRYSASVGRADTNVKSGVALKQLDQQSDQGSYHFIDHYDDMLQHIWRMAIELLPYYDDTAKDVPLHEQDGSVVMKRINDPTYKNPNTGEAEHFKVSELWNHAVTISTGPSFDSERDAANELADALLNNPTAFPLVAGDAIRLKNVGPIGDQMAEDLDALQPPALQARKAQAKGPKDPQVLTQKVQQLTEQLQHAQQLLQQAADEQKTEAQKITLKGQADARIKAIEARKDVTLQAMKDATSIRVAQINAAKERESQDNEHALELIALGHEKDMQAMQHAHDAAIQAMTMGHDAEQGDLQRGHEAEQADKAQEAAAQQSEEVTT